MLSRVNWIVDTLVAAVATPFMIEFDHGDFGMMKGCLSRMRCFQMSSWKRNGELDWMNLWFMELPRFILGCGVS